MDLWIVRHGPNDLGGSEAFDRNRSLIELGREHVRGVAEQMKRDGEVPRVILASPFARTMETADLMGEIFDVRVCPSTDLCPWNPILPYIVNFMANDLSGIMMVSHHTGFERILDSIGDKKAPSVLACAEARRYEFGIGEDGWRMDLRYRVTPESIGLKGMIV